MTKYKDFLVYIIKGKVKTPLFMISRDGIICFDIYLDKKKLTKIGIQLDNDGNLETQGLFTIPEVGIKLDKVYSVLKEQQRIEDNWL